MQRIYILEKKSFSALDNIAKWKRLIECWSLNDVISGLRRPDTHLNSTDAEDEWQAIDNVRFIQLFLISKQNR